MTSLLMGYLLSILVVGIASGALERVREHVSVRGVASAVLSGIGAVAGSYAVAGFTPEFVFTPVSSVVVHNTPAFILNTMRDTIGDYAMTINITFTVALTIGLFVAVSALAVVAGGRRLGPVPVGRGTLTTIFVWLLAVFLTGSPLLSLGAAVPAAFVPAFLFRSTGERAVGRGRTDDLSLKEGRWPDSDRRALLKSTAGVASFAGAAYLIGNYRSPAADLPELDVSTDPDSSLETPDELLTEAEEKSFDLPDSPPMVSEIGSFYTIDINSVAPRIDSEEWTLSVTGSVEEELTISYDELQEMETVHQFSTLRCVGEELNARKMDNGVWTGVPATELMDRAGATGEFTVMRADDGFWNVVPTEAFERSYVVYGMNGRVLPREHGHPARVIVPGRWGETNVKWLDEIEFVDEDVEGYWEERGWEGTGEVSAVTKLWTVDHREDGVLLGGQAYDGLDGVAAVEVSVDGRDSWEEADLSEELSVGDAWHQWRYEWSPDPGEYDVVVRLRDGNGELQEEEPTDDFPDGATGWVSDTVTVN